MFDLYNKLDCKTVRILRIQVRNARAVKQKVWNEAENRERDLGRDAKNTDCLFCRRYFRSNYPLLSATGNSHWLNFDASCQQAVK